MSTFKSVFTVISALVFSAGVLSIGYGFWTDSLNIEGDTDVRVRVGVVDDIIEQPETSPAALEIVIEPLPVTNGESNSGISSSTEPVTEIPAPEGGDPPVTDPTPQDPQNQPEQPTPQDPQNQPEQPTQQDPQNQPEQPTPQDPQNQPVQGGEQSGDAPDASQDQTTTLQDSNTGGSGTSDNTGNTGDTPQTVSP